jgi:hypothetical protein
MGLFKNIKPSEEETQLNRPPRHGSGFGEVVVDEDRVLLCPVCGGTNLHQLSIDAYQRVEEDAEARLTRVPVGGGVPEHALVDPSNVPGRRDALCIEFVCEECHGPDSSTPYALWIQQHKGCTYLSWGVWTAA